MNVRHLILSLSLSILAYGNVHAEGKKNDAIKGKETNGGSYAGIIQKAYFEIILPGLRNSKHNARVLRKHDIQALIDLIGSDKLNISMVNTSALLLEPDRYENPEGGKALVTAEHLFDNRGQIADCRVVKDTLLNEYVIQFHDRKWEQQIGDDLVFPAGRYLHLAHELLRYAFFVNRKEGEKDPHNLVDNNYYYSKQLRFGPGPESKSMQNLVEGKYFLDLDFLDTTTLIITKTELEGYTVSIKNPRWNNSIFDRCPSSVTPIKFKNSEDNVYFLATVDCAERDYGGRFSIILQIFQISPVELMVKMHRPSHSWQGNPPERDFSWEEMTLKKEYLDEARNPGNMYATFKDLASMANVVEERDIWNLHAETLSSKPSLEVVKSIISRSPHAATEVDFNSKLPIGHSAYSADVDVLRFLASRSSVTMIDIEHMLSLLFESKAKREKIRAYFDELIALYSEIPEGKFYFDEQQLIKVVAAHELYESFESLLQNPKFNRPDYMRIFAWRLSDCRLNVFVLGSAPCPKDVIGSLIKLMLKHPGVMDKAGLLHLIGAAIVADDAESLAQIHVIFPLQNEMQEKYLRYEPLHRAVEKNSMRAAEFLLKIGLSPTYPDRYKEAPLSVAVRYNHFAMAKLVYSYIPKGTEIDYSYGIDKIPLVALSARSAKGDAGWDMLHWLLFDLNLNPNYPVTLPADGKMISVRPIDFLAYRRMKATSDPKKRIETAKEWFKLRGVFAEPVVNRTLLNSLPFDELD